MTTKTHNQDNTPPLKIAADTSTTSNKSQHQLVDVGSASPKMEKMLCNCEEDLTSLKTETKSLPAQSASDIFYAMMNGEAIEEDPTSDIDDELMISRRSHHSSSAGSTRTGKSSKKSSMTATTTCATKRSSWSAPPTVITIDEHECTNDSNECVEPLKKSVEEDDDTNQEFYHSSKRPNSNSIFYQLAHEVRTKFELREKAGRFQECVDVRDRTKNLVVYKQCFVGSEAVDAMIYTKLVETREDAVKLAGQLQHELGFFRHVRGKRHLFKDSDDSFYQYTNTGGGNGDSNTSKKMDSCDSSVQSGLTNSERHQYCPSEESLENMAKAFRGCVELKDRRFRLKTYKQCFVGSEAVDILVQTRLVETRKDAVEFGRTLMRELGLFQHVTGDHSFLDEPKFYRFTEHGKPQSRMLPMSLATL